VHKHQEIIPYFNNNMDKESDYPIFQLAKTLRILQVFGPVPPMQMLIRDILHQASLNHHDLYIQSLSTLASRSLVLLLTTNKLLQFAFQVSF
jgi:hypothetical protein